MGGSKKVKTPPPPPPAPPPPTREDPLVQEAIEKERQLDRRRKGRRSTILTSDIKPLAEGELGKKTLLGQ